MGTHTTWNYYLEILSRGTKPLEPGSRFVEGPHLRLRLLLTLSQRIFLLPLTFLLDANKIVHRCARLFLARRKRNVSPTRSHQSRINARLCDETRGCCVWRARKWRRDYLSKTNIDGKKILSIEFCTRVSPLLLSARNRRPRNRSRLRRNVVRLISKWMFVALRKRWQLDV